MQVESGSILNGNTLTEGLGLRRQLQVSKNQVLCPFPHGTPYSKYR